MVDVIESKEPENNKKKFYRAGNFLLNEKKEASLNFLSTL
jgi:hypothetical protein